MDVTTEIRSFIFENFLYGDESRELKVDDSIYESGIVDSTGVLSIINFIEERFNLSVGDEEIIPENFDSIARIAAYIGRKLGGMAEA